MAKIIKLCPICGGTGKFIMQKCDSCDGSGGVLLKLTKGIKQVIEENSKRLSEQQTIAIELYKSGFSQKEIAKKMNLTKANIATLLYEIEKKLIGSSK